MSVARFRVAFTQPLDGALAATIVVDRASGLFSVRLYRRKRVYELPLAYLAEHVVWRCVRFELAERALERRKAQKERRAIRRRR